MALRAYFSCVFLLFLCVRVQVFVQIPAQHHAGCMGVPLIVIRKDTIHHSGENGGCLSPRAENKGKPKLSLQHAGPGIVDHGHDLAMDDFLDLKVHFLAVR
ncbi:hypothetical protein KMAL_28600 [Novacetimonas maltaceti]|uniref:Uncharacterized protein n=1 Tax=Novacetimonas maltaceti TaxID=1203393 RepID=A0A2S3VY46_9PROT|nr:hypothetical protein S101446_03428 [Komagataeibacter europaeus]POF61522.1 hypothetical protein KMAL_28600 [Novacetimonas maltaceti]